MNNKHQQFEYYQQPYNWLVLAVVRIDSASVFGYSLLKLNKNWFKYTQIVEIIKASI
jgi:hypothetical protein